MLPTLTLLALLAAPSQASPMTDALHRHGLTAGKPPADDAARAAARAHNSAAMDLYNAGDLNGARDRFVQAIDADNTFALAHYNLACVLSLMLHDPMTLKVAVCPQHSGATPAGALYHLARAVELDPKRHDRMRKDSDLDLLRYFLAYKAFDGADLSDPASLREALKDTKYWGPKPGAHPAARLLLRADGTAQHMDLEGDFVQTERKGTWKVLDDGTIELTLDSGVKTFTATPLGALTGESRTYDADADACSA